MCEPSCAVFWSPDTNLILLTQPSSSFSLCSSRTASVLWPPNASQHFHVRSMVSGNLCLAVHALGPSISESSNMHCTVTFLSVYRPFHLLEWALLLLAREKLFVSRVRGSLLVLLRLAKCGKIWCVQKHTYRSLFGAIFTVSSFVARILTVSRISILKNMVFAPRDTMSIRWTRSLIEKAIIDVKSS